MNARPERTGLERTGAKRKKEYRTWTAYRTGTEQGGTGLNRAQQGQNRAEQGGTGRSRDRAGTEQGGTGRNRAQQEQNSNAAGTQQERGRNAAGKEQGGTWQQSATTGWNR